MNLKDFNEIYSKLKKGNNSEIKQNEYKYLLSPYKVNNAIIMAAGMSSRFAPLSYDKPKGLTKVKGEILIERQIKQLLEAGIKEIVVVTGYLANQFDYLKDKYNVILINNPDYFRYNNTSSLILVLDYLKNTYICSSDNYFDKNPFKTYEYQSYYPVKINENTTNEYYVTFDETYLINDVSFNGGDYYMMGQVFFDKNTSTTFKEILRKQYQRKDVKKMLWERLYMEFMDEIDLYAKIDRENIIHEFDSFDELRVFDKTYINYQNNQILNNIANHFKVEVKDICNILDYQNKNEKLAFKFEVAKKTYLYTVDDLENNKFTIKPL